MKKVLLYILVFLLLCGDGIGIGYYIRSQTLNTKTAMSADFGQPVGKPMAGDATERNCSKKHDAQNA